MSDEQTEEISHLEQLIATHRRALRVYELQAAIFGQAQVPAHIVFGQEDAERQLQQALAQLRRLRPTSVAQDAPYRGLLTFQEANANEFFGRDALIASLLEKTKQTAFLAVLGPSGSGKSSVVRAGLIPMLKGGAVSGSEHWIYCSPLKPSARPLNSLASVLTSMPGGAALGSVFDLHDRLASRDDALLLAADTLLSGQDDARLVLLVDQAEELWTLAPTEPEAQAAFVAQQQRPFIDQILSAIGAPDSPLLVLFTMRADFLHRAAEHPALAHAIGEHDLIVSPMTRDELRDAIERPAELAGARFELRLVDELIHQTADRPGALPLLEYTLLELWNRQQADGTMTWAAFDTLGGVEGALAARADGILKEHYPTEAQQDRLRKVLMQLVKPGEGAADTRRRVRLDDLAPAGGTLAEVQALLKPLVDERLLTTSVDPTSGVESVDVAHEALIRAWPTFGTWINAARDDLRLQIQLGEAAQEWRQSDENTDFLWGGLRLANIEAWIARTQPALNVHDTLFLAACRAAEQQRRDAQETARQQELARERALSQERAATTRRLRWFVFGLAVAFIAAILLGTYAFIQRNVAQSQLDISEARRLTDLARDQLGSAPETALLIAYEALAHNDNLQSQDILREALDRHVRLVNIAEGHTDRVYSAVFSPDGQRILTASEDKTARLWDANGKELATLRGHTGPVYSAVFSPDGQRILTASDDGTARLWDTRGTELATLRGHTEPVFHAMFSPDGQRILTLSQDTTTLDTTARLWDTRGTELMTLGGSDIDRNFSAVFSPDGQRILTLSQDTTSRDSTARLWDTNGKELATLRGQPGSVYSAVFSSDGQRILTASEDKTARLWDANGKELATLRGHTGPVYSAVFSPDGQRILTASDDKTVRLWDANGKELATLRDLTGSLTSAVFSPDGQRILTLSQDTTSYDGTAQLWDANGKELATLRGHIDRDFSAVFSPDGQRILTTAYDNTPQLYLSNAADVLAIAACRVGRGLTDEEISRFQVPTPLKFDFTHRQCPPTLGR